MKQFLLPLAIVATMLAACSTDTKDSYSTANFGENNLIVNLDDPSAPAQVSTASYVLKLNWTQSCMSMYASDLVINNQKVSFETDTMAYRSAYLVANTGDYLEMGYFSKKSNVGKGAEVTSLDAFFTPGIYNITTLSLPGFDSTSVSTGLRLIMGYDLNNKYHVQTFRSMCFYMGKTDVSGSETFSTNNTAYRVELNFEKNTSRVAIYFPEFSNDNADVPKAIVLEEIPILFSHTGYHLQSDAPLTKVLGKDADGKFALIDSADYKATDFFFNITSDDLTEAAISYRINGKSVNFSGCSIVKASK